MDFNFFMPARVFSGKNTLFENSRFLADLGKSCLLVTGAGSAKASGALDDVLKALKTQGISYEIYDKIGPNPLLSDCHAAGKQAADFKADFIFGIGGGSPLDAAKAVAVYAANPKLEAEEIYNYGYGKPPLPLVLLGTTAGTGSEVTGVSVLTIDRNGRKKSVSGPDYYANLSFADPKYTYSVPYDATVSTALDAFSHALESFFTPKCQGLTKCVAQKALSGLWPALESLNKSKSLPSPEVRDALYYGSLYAGLAINQTGTAFPHPLGYILTEDFGLPHGKACAVFMPAFLERAENFAPDLHKELFELLQTDKGRLLKTVKSLVNSPDLRIDGADAKKYAERWALQAPGNFAISPGGLNFEEAAEILATLKL
ncbi:MAG: iron-containing alcohol dehydrogenase [Clostridiales bacterium]|nr:iron-containing alcohol dehydrogenase [Clostridiales bacterium]